MSQAPIPLESYLPPEDIEAFRNTAQLADSGAYGYLDASLRAWYEAQAARIAQGQPPIPQAEFASFGNPPVETVQSAQAPAVPAAQTAPVASPAAPTNDDADYWQTWEVNTEAFNRGWGSWQPPVNEGTYEAVYRGNFVPERNTDQRHFIFEAPEGQPYFKGTLVTAALVAEDSQKSGGGKLKDVLDKLGITYRVLDDFRIQVQGRSPGEGRPCRVLWQNVTVNGRTEMRIQDVYSADAEVAI